AARLGLVETARAAFGDAIKSDDLWNKTLGELGLGRLAKPGAEARAHFLRARESSKELEMLAFLPAIELGAFADARDTTTALLQQSPAAILPRYMRAVARIALGDTKNGLNDLKKALERSAPLGVLEDVKRLITGSPRAIELIDEAM